jgi:hypothetical protein
LLTLKIPKSKAHFQEEKILAEEHQYHSINHSSTFLGARKVAKEHAPKKNY